jgi:hypothetical protein
MQRKITNLPPEQKAPFTEWAHPRVMLKELSEEQVQPQVWQQVEQLAGHADIYP